MLSTAPPEDLTGGDRVLLDVRVPEKCYRHQPIVVRIRVALDEQFLAEQMLQLFGRPLDVPIQIDAPWFESWPAGVVRLGPVDPSAPSVAIAFGSRELRAVRSGLAQGDRQYAVLELERTLVPEKVGEIELPEVVVRLAYATEFEEDLLRGRVAVERRDAVVRSGGRSLRVRPLPEIGRPNGYGGAVGDFTATTGFEDSDAARSPESVVVRMRISGDGNFEFFEPPSLRSLRGLHEQGRRVVRAADSLTVWYTLTRVPGERVRTAPLEFPYFDPWADTYRTLRIPFRLDALPSDPASGHRASPSEAPSAVDPLADGARAEESGRFPVWPWIAGMLAAAAGAIVLTIATRAKPRT